MFTEARWVRQECSLRVGNFRAQGLCRGMFLDSFHERRRYVVSQMLTEDDGARRRHPGADYLQEDVQ